MSSLADRTKIMRKAVWPDINFAIQVILNCGQDIAGTCDGGDPGVCTPSTRSAVVVW
jgi:cathepsin X